jgi:hypothetical protein
LCNENVVVFTGFWLFGDAAFEFWSV